MKTRNALVVAATAGVVLFAAAANVAEYVKHLKSIRK